MPCERHALILSLTVATAMLTAADAVAQSRDVCVRLESQLAELDAPGGGSAAQAGRYDRAIAEQTRHLHNARIHRNQAGCGQSGFLFFRPARPAQCDALDAQLRRIEANLEQLHAERARFMPRRGGGSERARRDILAALARNDCGAQYARSGSGGRPGTLFDRLFDERTRQPTGHDYGYGYGGPGGTYRTLCVRSCDGFFWPVSFSTVQGRFGADAESCRASCPGSPVELYVHRNPGEETEDSVSLAGAPYTALPNAFRFRDEYDSDCTCRRPAQIAARIEQAAGGTSLAALDSADMAPAASPPLNAPSLDEPVTSVPLPRPRPGTEPSGHDPVAATPGPASAPAPDPDGPVSRDGRPVRVVGPGFSYFRPDGG
jgi:hypothetical protein